MFDFLHELIPLFFKSYKEGDHSEPEAVDRVEYETVVYEANHWILKDPNDETRNEMRTLLEECRFDEIYELIKRNIDFKEPGVVVGKFQCGLNRINFNTVQMLIEALAQLTELNEKTTNVLTIHNSTDRARSLAERITATWLSYKFTPKVKNDVKASLASEFTNNLYEYVISVEDLGGEIRIEIYDRQGKLLSEEFTDEVSQRREKINTNKNLSQYYDYETNRLK